MEKHYSSRKISFPNSKYNLKINNGNERKQKPSTLKQEHYSRALPVDIKFRFSLSLEC